MALDFKSYMMLDKRQAKDRFTNYSFQTTQEYPVKTFNIATIPAYGIGPEVIEAGVAVLDALAVRDGGFSFNFQNFDW